MLYEPAEDTVATLGDLLVRASKSSNAKPDELVSFLGMEDVSEEGEIIISHTLLNKEVRKGLTYFENGDVLVAKITPCFENGKGANLNHLPTKRGYGSTEFHILRAGATASADYIFYHTQSVAFRKKLEGEMIGTAGQKRVPLAAIKNYPLPVAHTLAEQQAIAAALGEVDALLAAQRARLAKQQRLKQGLLQTLLRGEKRLPGFAGEWEVKRLGDVGKCLRGVSYNPANDLESHDTNHTVRLLRSNNVQMGSIDTDGLQFVQEYRVKTTQFLQPNDVVICMANGSKKLVGKAAAFNVADGYRYTFGAFMGCYRCFPNEASPQFLFYLFQTEIYRQYIANLLAGSSINNLNPSSIEQMEMEMPPPDEQRAIAAVLSEADAALAALEAEHAKTQLLKQGLMQNLLTGKLRLPL